MNPVSRTSPIEVAPRAPGAATTRELTLPRLAEHAPSPQGQAWWKLLLSAAIVVAAALRFAGVGTLPPSLNQDEVISGYDAYSLFLTSRDHLGHPFPFAGLESFGDWVSPLLTFLTAPAVGLFGLRAEAVRAVPAAVGVLAVPGIYLLALQLFQRRSTALIAAWLLALSPWAVHRGHFAIPPSIVPTMVALTLLALAWALRGARARGVVLLGGVAGLTVASYPTMKLYVPLLLIAGLAIYWPQIRLIEKEALTYGAVVFLAIALPIWYLSLADPAGRARLDQISILHSPELSPRLLATNYLHYFSPRVFFLSGSPHPGWTGTPPGRGIESLALLPALAAGAAWLCCAATRDRAAKRRPALLVLAAVALYPIPGALTLPPTAHLGRATHLIPLLALVAGCGIVAIWDLARRTRLSWTVGIAGLLLAGVWGVDLASRYLYYFRDFAGERRVAEYFQYGAEQAVTYAASHEPEYDQIWLDDVNEPYAYVLFYTRWPPTELHDGLQVERHPPLFNEVKTLGKYRFDVPLEDYDLGDVRDVAEVRDPAGRPAFTLQDAAVAGAGRVLLVRRAERS